MGAAHDHQHPLAGDSPPGQHLQPLFDVGRKCRCTDIEAQLNRGCLLSGVLATRPDGPDETLVDVVLPESDAFTHSNLKHLRVDLTNTGRACNRDPAHRCPPWRRSIRATASWLATRRNGVNPSLVMALTSAL